LVVIVLMARISFIDSGICICGSFGIYWSAVQLPWKPSGILGGRRTRAMGWLVKSCAVRMTRSAAPRPGLWDGGHDVAVVLGGGG
jgi:hypothetical protein